MPLLSTNNTNLNDDVIQILYTKPYAVVSFPTDQNEIQQAIDAFFEFLKLPDDVKYQLTAKISPRHRRGEVGFQHRDPDDGIYNDSKDFFHYHPVLKEEHNQLIEETPVIRNFLMAANVLWEKVYTTVYEILEFFDKDHPGTLDKIFDAKNPHIILRFLKYNFNEAGKYLAKPHFDAGSFTLAIAESCPGLRIGTNPDDLEIVHHHTNQAIFMISSNIQKIIESNELKPGWHDVIQLEENKIGKPFARWALVAFIDGHNVEALPRRETHKWYTGDMA